MVPKKAAESGSSIPSPEEFRKFYTSTLSLINDLRDDDNERDLIAPFVKLPSKKLYPDYTDIVPNPISISDINRKVTKGKYSSTDTHEFVSDFELLRDNAALYNTPDSWIVDDATKILEFVEEQANQFSSGESQEITNENLADAAKVIVEDLIDYDFPEIGVVSGPFLEVVDKKTYPDYHKIIKKPTSFNKVLNDLDGNLIKQSDSVLDNIQRFHEAVQLIFTNAQTYNDPESLLYQDATKLSGLLDEKIEELKSKVVVKEPPKLKLTLKPPQPAVEPSRSDSRKRGRKKKVKVEEDSLVDDDMDIDDPEDADAPEDSEMKDEDEEEDEEEEAPVIPTMESNVMGRTDTLGPISENFIKEGYFGSTASTVSQISTQTIELDAYKTAQPPSRYHLNKESLFPTLDDTLSSLVEYKFPANGYCTQAYTLTLPPDASSYVTLRFSLHEYLFGLKSEDVRSGQGLTSVSSEEEFQCKLYLNDEEVENKADVDEQVVSSSKSYLTVQYETKLNYGMNIVTFECKVAPNTTKIIKKSQVRQDDNEEIAGRHTRHQLQQLRRSWEVEKFTFYVICNSL